MALRKMRARMETSKMTENKFDEIDRQIEAFQENPQIDPQSVIPRLTDEEEEKYMTRDGTYNYLAYEKDNGTLVTISPAAEEELNRSFKKWTIIFVVFVIVITGILAGVYH